MLEKRSCKRQFSHTCNAFHWHPPCRNNLLIWRKGLWCRVMHQSWLYGRQKTSGDTGGKGVQSVAFPCVNGASRPHVQRLADEFAICWLTWWVPQNNNIADARKLMCVLCSSTNRIEHLASLCLSYLICQKYVATSTSRANYWLR